MILECPHCYRTVSPMRGIECPACHNNVQEPPDHSLTVIEVGQKSQLPEMCAMCAIHTRRTIRLSSSLNYQSGHNDVHAAEVAEGVFRVGFGMLFGAAIGTLLSAATLGGGSNSSGSQVAVTVAVRQCKDCSRRHSFNPIKVDYDYHSMRIAVDDQFAAAFEELNAINDSLSRS